MKQGSTLFLKAVILLIGLAVLIGLLWFPWTEGRNVNADLISIYFRDPFLAYVYVASTPFFIALFQAFKLLGFIDKNNVFSVSAVDALKNIKYSAIAISTLMVIALLYVRYTAVDDDPAGAIVIGLVIVFTSIVIATAAAVFQRLLQNAVDIKSENDLTV